MNRTQLRRPLLAVALLVLLAGLVLVVVQPGNLGDDDESALQDGTDPTTSSTEPEDGDPSTATTAEPGDTTTSAGGQTTTSAAGQTTTSAAGQTTTTAAAGGGVTTTTTTATGGSSDPGSGLGSSGAPRPADTADGLADTGGESLIVAGLAMGAAGLAMRRRAEPERLR